MVAVAGEVVRRAWIRVQQQTRAKPLAQSEGTGGEDAVRREVEVVGAQLHQNDPPLQGQLHSPKKDIRPMGFRARCHQAKIRETQRRDDGAVGIRK
jgi:hypothetical protein